jgi:hypothetical protein
MFLLIKFRASGVHTNIALQSGCRYKLQAQSMDTQQDNLVRLRQRAEAVLNQITDLPPSGENIDEITHK